MNTTAKKVIAALASLTMCASLAACGGDTAPASNSKQDAGNSAPAEDKGGEKIVGIAMPTKSLERWNRDGEYL